jgi:hypothetical protein
MADGYFLTPDDYALFQLLVDDYRKRTANPRTRGRDDEDSIQSPGTYVALPQTTISALSYSGTSETPGEGDTPGSGLCDIYRLVEDSGKRLYKVLESQTVYNLSRESLSDWTLVHRDKFGEWYTSGIVPTATDETTGTDSDVGTGTSYCYGIPGVDFGLIPVEDEPSYVLGISSGGCLVRILTGNCITETGTGP